MPRDAPLALVVDLDRLAGLPDGAVVLRDAIHDLPVSNRMRDSAQSHFGVMLQLPIADHWKTPGQRGAASRVVTLK